MNLKHSKGLKELKKESITISTMKCIKGGTAYSYLSGDGGSKPKRPTGYNAYMSQSFGG